MINNNNILVNIKEKIESSYDSLYENFNKTEKDISVKTLNELFCDQVKKTPENIAISFNDNSITYKELDKESDMMAHYLVKMGVTSGKLLAVNGKRSIETIINIMAILKVGAGYVPIDPDYPKDRIDYIMKKSRTNYYISCDDYMRCKDHKKLYENSLDIEYNPSQIAYVIYTSGSTGEPKGVSITHEAAVNTILDINFKINITDKEKIVGLSSMCFDLSVYDIFGALLSGSELVMIRDQRDLKDVSKVLEERKITIWNSVPAIMSSLIGYVSDDYVNENMLCILLSGDWIPVYLPDKLKKAFPNAKIISLGGATEASIWSIYYEIKEVEDKWRSIPYGSPLANQKFYVLNYKKELCPVGVKGELYIGGKGLARGYYNDEEKTSESFMMHQKFGRIYRTGDYGIMHKEGYIEFCGRMDMQVKLNGYRIELGEIETCLANDSSVSEVIVLNTENGGINAYIKPSGAMKSSDYFRKGLLKKLPSYMIPNKFIKIDNIPLTINGKVDRKALIKVELDNKLENRYESPKTDVEVILAGIIEKTLNNGTKLGRKDSFYSIGINSVMMLEIINEIQEYFKIQVNIRNFIKVNNLIDLAAYINKEKESSCIESGVDIAYKAEKDNNSKGVKSFIELFLDNVFSNSDNYALINNKSQLSYKKLNEHSNKVANYLRSLDVIKGDKILVRINEDLNTIIGMLGIIKVGAIPVIVNNKCVNINCIFEELECRLLLDMDYIQDYSKIYDQSEKYKYVSSVNSVDVACIICSLRRAHNKDIGFKDIISGSNADNKVLEEEADNTLQNMLFNELTHKDIINKVNKTKSEEKVTGKDRIFIMTEDEVKYIESILEAISIGATAVLNNSDDTPQEIIEKVNKLNVTICNLDVYNMKQILQSCESESITSIKRKKQSEEIFFWSPVVQWSADSGFLHINRKKYPRKFIELFPDIYFKLQKGIKLEVLKLMYKEYGIDKEEFNKFINRLIEEKVLVNSLLTPEEVFSSQEVLYKSEYGDELIYNAEVYYKFKSEQLKREEYKENGNSIYLKCIDYPENIKNRRTCRKFRSDKSIPFPAISQFISTLKQCKENEEIHYHYASAGGFYPIDTYIYVKNDKVQGISAGVYYYNPIKNCLIKINSNIISSDAYYYINKEIFNSSALTIYFVYNADVSMPRYSFMGYYYSCLDTGIIVSTLTQMAELLNLGVCSIGDINYEMISNSLCLDKNKILIHTLEVGLKEREQKSEFLQKVCSGIGIGDIRAINDNKDYIKLFGNVKIIKLYGENIEDSFKERVQKNFNEVEIVFVN